MIMIASYVSALVAANLLVSVFGPMISPINAFLLIGLDLSMRDRFHEKWRDDSLFLRMGALIFCSAFISYMLDPAAGIIAVASMASFVLSNSADAVAYGCLHGRSYFIKSNGSNVIGSAVDSVVFPFIAFGSLMPEIVMLQFFAKLFGGFVWSVILSKFLKGETND